MSVDSSFESKRPKRDKVDISFKYHPKEPMIVCPEVEFSCSEEDSNSLENHEENHEQPIEVIEEEEMMDGSQKLLNPEDPERETSPPSDSDDEDYPSPTLATKLTVQLLPSLSPSFEHQV